MRVILISAFALHNGLSVYSSLGAFRPTNCHDSNLAIAPMPSYMGVGSLADESRQQCKRYDFKLIALKGAYLLHRYDSIGSLANVLLDWPCLDGKLGHLSLPRVDAVWRPFRKFRNSFCEHNAGFSVCATLLCEIIISSFAVLFRVK